MGETKIVQNRDTQDQWWRTRTGAMLNLGLLRENILKNISLHEFNATSLQLWYYDENSDIYCSSENSK